MQIQGRLMVEARKHNAYLEGRERSIPIEGPSNYKRVGSRSSSYSPRDRDGGYDSGRGSGEGKLQLVRHVPLRRTLRRLNYAFSSR